MIPRNKTTKIYYFGLYHDPIMQLEEKGEVRIIKSEKKTSKGVARFNFEFINQV
jgi:hypothetical protein